MECIVGKLIRLCFQGCFLTKKREGMWRREHDGSKPLAVITICCFSCVSVFRDKILKLLKLPSEEFNKNLFSLCLHAEV